MKKTNKGFSLVELIIVIAIMAILAGAIAPALIKYIDKSRKSNDVSSAKTIKTALETALGTESVYEKLVPETAGNVCKMVFLSGEECQALSSNANACSAIIIAGANADDTGVATEAQAKTLIGANIGEKIPKIKYKKQTGTVTPKNYYATINDKGTVSVGVTSSENATFTAPADGQTSSANCIALAPVLDEDYQ